MSQKPKDTKSEDFADKIAHRHVEEPVEMPKGDEIKHDWLWRRMGAWFQDNGKSEVNILALDTAFLQSVKGIKQALICRCGDHRDWHIVIRSQQCRFAQ